MATRAFTQAERWAVFEAHGSKCWLCYEPVDFVDMEVDHVIPEQLIGDEQRLKHVLGEFGLPAEFDLNSFENWLPAHGSCNRQKGDQPFEATPLIQRWIARARDKAAKARE